MKYEVSKTTSLQDVLKFQRCPRPQIMPAGSLDTMWQFLRRELSFAKAESSQIIND